MTANQGEDAPVRAGDVDDAIRRMRVAAAASGRGGGPGAAGTADPDVVRAALAALPHDDQRLLWDRHVLRHDTAAVARALGIHPRAVGRRLVQAERGLGSALAVAHLRGCPPRCLDTRRSMDALLRRRLSPGHSAVLEEHLVGCAGCLRALVDVREPAWAVQDAGPLLVAGGGWAPSAPVAAEPPERATPTGPRGPRRPQSWLIVAGTVAGVAVTAVAIALGSGDSAPASPGHVPASSTVAVRPGGPPAPGASSGPQVATSPEPTTSAVAEVTPTRGASSPTPTGEADGDGTTPGPSATSPATETTRPPTSSATATSAPDPSSTGGPRPAPTRTSPTSGSSTPTPDATTDPPTDPTTEPPTEPTTDPPAEPTDDPTPSDDPTSTDPPA